LKINLKHKHKVAADHWLIHINQTKAMLAAGYSKMTAGHEQSIVFDREDVKLYIQDKRRIMGDKAEVSAEYIIRKYKEIIEANMGEVLVIDDEGRGTVDLNKASPAFMASLSSYSADEFSEGRGKTKREGKRIRVQLQDKLRALEALGRHLGLFNDKITIEGQVDLVQRIQQGRERARIRDITQDVELMNDEV
tara:strand:+ start:540 stop:1118 length:579 start_codon:yes stop_codon:yes gene_type:complete